MMRGRTDGGISLIYELGANECFTREQRDSPAELHGGGEGRHVEISSNRYKVVFWQRVRQLPTVLCERRIPNARSLGIETTHI